MRILNYLFGSEIKDKDDKYIEEPRTVIINPLYRVDYMEFNRYRFTITHYIDYDIVKKLESEEVYTCETLDYFFYPQEKLNNLQEELKELKHKISIGLIDSGLLYNYLEEQICLLVKIVQMNNYIKKIKRKL